MIFNDDLLYFHVPRTGGTSVEAWLLDVLPGPIYWVLPTRLHDRPDRSDIVTIAGTNHEGPNQAEELLRGLGRSLADFKAVVVTVRDPYALAVSHYAYRHWDAGRNLHALEPYLTREQLSFHEQLVQTALDGELEEFLGVEDCGHVQGLSDYSTPDLRRSTSSGNEGGNLRVVHFEHLEAELSAVLASIGVRPAVPIPVMNVAPHVEPRFYLSERSEELIYKKLRLEFDEGHYERISTATMDPSSLPEPETARDLPIEAQSDIRVISGPASGISGLYADHWVGDSLCFTVDSDCYIDSLSITGAIPSFAADLRLAVSSHGLVSTVEISEPGAFEVEASVYIPAKRATTLRITPSSTWSRREHGGHDIRRLSFYLRSLGFRRYTCRIGGSVKIFGEPISLADPSMNGSLTSASVMATRAIASVTISGFAPPGSGGALVVVLNGRSRHEVCTHVEGLFRIRAPFDLPEGVVGGISVIGTPADLGSPDRFTQPQERACVLVSQVDLAG